MSTMDCYIGPRDPASLARAVAAERVEAWGPGGATALENAPQKRKTLDNPALPRLAA
jgi:hypothetical protein